MWTDSFRGLPHRSCRAPFGQAAHGEERSHGGQHGQKRGQHQNDEEREPVLGQDVQIADHADARWHEEQRQVGEDDRDGGAQVTGQGGPKAQDRDEQGEPEDGAGDRETDAPDGDFSDKLAGQEQPECWKHGNLPLQERTPALYDILVQIMHSYLAAEDGRPA